MTDQDYMREALALAHNCLPDDVPVGCVVVSPDGTIIGRGRNRREADSRATAHAEIEAINQACAAREEKSGCCGSVLNLFEERFNHRPRVYGGLLEGECRELLEDFFQGLRKI